MAGRFYSNESPEQELARKRNEWRRAFASMFINSAIALGGSGVASLYNNRANPDWNVSWWFLLAIGLICVALYILWRVEPEY
jgi:hypothetical protein